MYYMPADTNSTQCYSQHFLMFQLSYRFLITMPFKKLFSSTSIKITKSTLNNVVINSITYAVEYSNVPVPSG